MNAFWFNPRNGKWNIKGKEFTEQKPFMKNIASGTKAPVKEFDPPGKVGAGNDWVLVLNLEQIPEPTLLIGGFLLGLAFLRRK